MSGRTVDHEATLPRSVYFSEPYLHPNCWMSMRSQVESVVKLRPNTILEIGIGNGIVNVILRHWGFRVISVDVNAQLQPDVVGSVVVLGSLLHGECYDVVLCAEVLEHLSFDLFEMCLDNIHAATRSHAVITLPYSGDAVFYARGRFPKLGDFDLSVRIRGSQVLPEHHWEIDSSERTRLTRILELMARRFRIVRHNRVPGHPKQHLFVLQKPLRG